MPQVTLCTYTYNDAPLASGLLRQSLDWTLQPTARLVVDDGSAAPFAPAADFPAPVKMLRLSPNGGPAAAKSAGISLADTELVLSLDCDIRLDPGWLALATGEALNPEVGLVGCAISQDGGPGVVGRFLKHFDNVDLPEGEAEFITGGVWLFRREVWLATNGFNGYAGRTHEDHHFCQLVKGLGLRMLITGAPGRQERVLSRTAMAKRFATWLGAGMRRGVDSPESLEAQAALLTQKMMIHVNFALERGEPLFIYLELLLLACFGALSARGLPAERAFEKQAAVSALLNGIHDRLAPYPALASLFDRDLAALNLERPAARYPSAPTAAIWNEALGMLDMLAKGGLFAAILAKLALLREEDGDRADFSFYTELDNTL